MTKKASSVKDFCDEHGISRSMFYKLHKQGLAPMTFRVGKRRLIADDEAAAWREAMKAPALPKD